MSLGNQIDRLNTIMRSKLCQFVPASFCTISELWLRLTICWGWKMEQTDKMGKSFAFVMIMWSFMVQSTWMTTTTTINLQFMLQLPDNKNIWYLDCSLGSTTKFCVNNVAAALTTTIRTEIKTSNYNSNNYIIASEKYNAFDGCGSFRPHKQVERGESRAN